MFCPRCGKEGEEFKGLCLKCYLNENPLRVKDISLKLCNCGNIYYKGNWSMIEDIDINKIIENNIIIPERIMINKIKTKSDLNKFRDNIGGKRICIDVSITGRYYGRIFRKTISVEIKTKKDTCPSCRKISDGYYESILQFRVKSPHKLIEKEIDISKITKIEIVKGGVDLYIVSSSYGRSVAKKLKEKGFLIKESSKITGRRDGKHIYRTSISIKEPPFSYGDFISYDNNILQIIEMGGIVKLMDIKSRKIISLSMSRIKDIKPIARVSDIRKSIITSVRPDEIQILDLHNHEIYEIKSNMGKKRELKQGDEVDFIRINNKPYII